MVADCRTGVLSCTGVRRFLMSEVHLYFMRNFPENDDVQGYLAYKKPRPRRTLQ